ncbi:hypothetical protein TcasGA2_TC009860 [Tribolium castaneum]|uniref:Uncharacterized protein n=1 Tax=Tribolium castaneum TaxID=7070 RepID=D6WQ27_TRICA|nr:hypothetical protein TcasGA2_TC009860 [Tribolium castaneum]
MEAVAEGCMRIRSSSSATAGASAKNAVLALSLHSAHDHHSGVENVSKRRRHARELSSRTPSSRVTCARRDCYPNTDLIKRGTRSVFNYNERINYATDN